MKIHFVGHACVAVECSGTSILIDPWFSGKIFNNSWTLRPDPVFDPALLDRIDYVWISHEHPDHCHFPTLASFPDSFKQRATILFQARDSEKMIAAFKGLGYRHFRLLPHREIVPLTNSAAAGITRVYCYHAGLMDSALAVLDDGEVILNANDARISTGECKLIRRDLGRVDVLLHQFSLAAYAGFEPPERHLPTRAEQILRNMSEVHRALDARVTIPFASFIYFSTEDNKYVNRYANTVADGYDYLNRQGQHALVLYPGDSYQVGSEHESAEALHRYNALPGWDELPYDPIETKPLDAIFEAYAAMAEQIRERFSHALLLALRPVAIRIPDLDKTVEFSLAKARIGEVSDSRQPDLSINSQPLWFGFKFPFGIQTLGVSARFTLHRNFRNWKMHRILFSLNNGGIYLKPKYVFTPD
ncbi:MAG TPA: MBL fold metallo-hydrolase, partial [Patescibacteria group bacterium]|nr:MBL fold metallo-hydrolase [Patescibacteria group bacterium]